MDRNGLLGIAWHWPPLTRPAESNAGPGLMSGRYAARKQFKGTSALGRDRPTNALNSLPETCRWSWAVMQLTFV
jgi:hypothetical protein